MFLWEVVWSQLSGSLAATILIFFLLPFVPLTSYGGSPIPLYLYMWPAVYSPSYLPPSLCVIIVLLAVPVHFSLDLFTSVFLHHTFRCSCATYVGTELHCTLVLRPSYIRWHCGVHSRGIPFALGIINCQLQEIYILIPVLFYVVVLSYPSILLSGITALNWMFQQHPFLADVIIQTVSQILKIRLPEPCFCAKNSFATLY